MTIRVQNGPVAGPAALACLRSFAVRVLAGLAIAACSPAFSQVLDFTKFARDLVDLEGLSRVDFVPTRMESSYDRTGGNADGVLPDRLKDGVYTIADLKGPGVIRRFYAGTPGGILRVYIDDQPKPVIEMPCAEFFSGAHEPFVRPVVGPMGGSNHSYFPIPYAKSIRIQTTARADIDESQPRFGALGPYFRYGVYYQVTYQTFPPETNIQSLRLPLSATEQGEWNRVVALWRAPGHDPKTIEGNQTTTAGEVRVAPGATVELADVSGPGAIDAIFLKIEPSDARVLRSTLLRMRWDDEKLDAVDCPVGDFFGNAFSRVLYRSLPMGLTDAGYYTYFSMPFSQRGRINIVNQSADLALTVRFRIAFHKTAGMPANVGYFHAKWRRQEVVAVDTQQKNTTGGYNYRILDVHGQGRYIGTNLNVFNRHLFWWGEGDPMIFIDNEIWPPSLHGTGTEEYFNDGWDFHEYIQAVGADPKLKEQNVIAISGVLIPGIESPHNCYGGNAVFVFHVADSMPFRERIQVTIEHGAANNLTNDYSSTAYWYARPGDRDFFVMRPAEERIAIPVESWESRRHDAKQMLALPR